LQIARLSCTRDLQVKWTARLGQGLRKAIQARDLLTADRCDHVARPQTSIESRRPREDSLHDNLVWNGVVNDDAILIERIKRDDSLRQCRWFHDQRLLHAVAENHHLHRMYEIRSRQELVELSFGGDGLAIHRNDPVSCAETCIGEDAIVRNVRDDQAIGGPAAKPQAQVRGASGLNVLPCLLARLAGCCAGLRDGLAGLAGFRTRITGLLASFLAGLACRLAWRWGNRPGCNAARRRRRRRSIAGQNLPIRCRS